MNQFNLTQFECRILNLVILLVNGKNLNVFKDTPTMVGIHI